MAALRIQEGIAAKTLKFLILTADRGDNWSVVGGVQFDSWNLDDFRHQAWKSVTASVTLDDPIPNVFAVSEFGSTFTRIASNSAL
ncbi:MAG: hypothetical protein M3Q16_05525 [Pseudomonadota bacterium]|nr:hypothetical protein [Pseudomonadota bacterium]